jgi:hypothetical protein
MTRVRKLECATGIWLLLADLARIKRAVLMRIERRHLTRIEPCAARSVMIRERAVDAISHFVTSFSE